MTKYVATEDDLNTLFNSTAWQDEELLIIPVNFSTDQEFPEKHCRFSIVSSGDGITSYARLNTTSGVVMIEIFTPAGGGPKDTKEIAGILDSHLQGKTIGGTQFFKSSLGGIEKDKENPSLARAIYQIPFTHSGVL